MSDMTDYELVPPLTLGWRLKMALDLAGMSNEQMAEALGVNKATISRWMNGKGKPPHRAYIKQWSHETHVGLRWLETGEMPVPGVSPLPSTGSDRYNPLAPWRTDRICDLVLVAS